MGKYEICSVQGDTFEMDYIKFGTGKKPFVIIPGLSLRSILFSASTIATTYSTFSEDYTIYVFDRKREIEPNYSIKDMAMDTANAMKILGIKGAYMLGTSQGGMICQYIAILYPELISAMVLGSTLCRANDTSKKVISSWVSYGEKRDVQGLNRSIFNNIYSEEHLEAHSRAFELIENDGTEKEMERFVILAKACLDFDCYNSLNKIHCPVFVIGDNNDKVVTAEASVEIAEKLNCQLYMYQGYSHAVYDEALDYRDRIWEFFHHTNENNCHRD